MIDIERFHVQGVLLVRGNVSISVIAEQLVKINGSNKHPIELWV